jgi:hypothetical protein
MILQENINRMRYMMGLSLNESLNDTAWENEKGDKATLIDLLKVTEDIPVVDFPVEYLKEKVISWNNDPEEQKKIDRADLQYPILIFVDNNGEFLSIIDGNHRVQKAIKLGNEFIDAKIITLSKLPRNIKKVFQHLNKQGVNEQLRDVLKNLTKVSKPLVSNLDDILKKFSYFETAQGSKYIRNDKGQLRRWKSVHANTGGEDMGLHGWSSQSIFVPKNYENEANSLQHLIGKGFKTAMSKNKDGKLVIMVADKGKWRPATWSDAYPNYVKSNPSFKDKVIGFEYSKEPKMGYSVVDFDLKPSSTEIKSYHFGSPVSKIETQIPKEEIKRFFPTQN